jgi:phage baseplate assembly protein W
MNRATGAPLSGDDHLAQSCEDIVTTPLGTRTMRRDYGCLLAELVDRPLNRATTLLASMAIALALARWEPRITVRQVTSRAIWPRPGRGRDHRHQSRRARQQPHPPDHPLTRLAVPSAA